MPDWLAGFRRRSPSFPRYRALASHPCALPPEVTAEEGNARCTALRQRLESELLEPARRPAEELPLFITFVTESGEIVTLPGADPSDPCLPVFSSYPRAADYREARLRRRRELQYLPLSAIEFARTLGELRDGTSVTAFSVDRCPRCDAFSPYGIDTIPSPSDAIMIWAIVKAAELARLEVAHRHAEAAAGRGEIGTARDLLLTIVGHVAAEDPRAHVLLGELGLRLGDRQLTRDARAFLEFLDEPDAARRLGESAGAGEAQQ